ncbi:hypothetical protein ASPWEDRAFT_48555 [Aspergillus wentii DTO 134E9]|uniref:Uncharacterized protein n=1 Tax=Aspergillus wentii DTO 134E9 TaxID=1073089 RepID=A0A1L9RTY1_ASPWE|nr:uncharacterized protein ASPWEDRAFT_48555 [Aspergillus wentii DTO 134E9]OJJ38267.1 hypothetical protein ASPWEDRAFT_48555 [Aspergillus wentii DTO 134E9]
MPDLIIWYLQLIDAVAGEFSSVPILGFSQTVSPATRPLFLSDLRKFLTQVGCFYLKNNSVSEQTLQGANSRHFLGYNRLGAEKTAGMVDHKESFTIGPELPTPSQDEPIYYNLRDTNMMWPASMIFLSTLSLPVPEFRSTIETYYSAMEKQATELTVLIAETLDLNPTDMASLFDNPPLNVLKIHKYPPPSIPVPLIPGTLVANVGRLLESLSRGVCIACTHRARLESEGFVSSDGKSLGPRFSLPFFQTLGLDLTQEDLSLDIPPHITDLVKEGHI